jgi:predicted transglutaminase-like cysteine proteinase
MTTYKKLSIRQIKTIARKIHKKVFSNFSYMTDLKQHGVEENWTMPDITYNGSQRFTGDCEDFALACRKLIREAGIKSRLVYCTVEDGEGHCVLEVNGYILDNRQHNLVSNRTLVKKGYNFIAISGYESKDTWRKLNS